MSGPKEAELVLTLPDLRGSTLYQAETRTTVGCLTQLVVEARSYVVIAAPFMQRGHGISQGPIAIALESALARGVDVAILGTREGLATLTIERLCRRSAAKLTLWEPSKHVSDPKTLGSHAKFCVVDGEMAYVGSANFTGPGLSRQLEMGVLVRGSVAAQIGAFWRLGCKSGFFQEVAAISGRAPSDWRLARRLQRVGGAVRRGSGVVRGR